MKLAVYLIDNQDGSDETTAAISQLAELNSTELYLLWHEYDRYLSLKFTPEVTNTHSNNDLQHLIKLLLAHPALCSRPGLVSQLNSQMLNLMGIHSSNVEIFREELQQHYGMIISPVPLLLKEPLPFALRHHLCFRLHSNFHNLIKKASLNLLRLPNTELYDERLQHDFTL